MRSLCIFVKDYVIDHKLLNNFDKATIKTKGLSIWRDIRSFSFVEREKKPGPLKERVQGSSALRYIFGFCEIMRYWVHDDIEYVGKRRIEEHVFFLFISHSVAVI